MAVKQEREAAMRRQRARAEDAAEDRILEVIVARREHRDFAGAVAVGRQHGAR